MTKRLIIILGYTLTDDGAVQPILKSRLDRALSIYQPTDTLLVCGKYAPKALIPRRCEHTTEAEAMKQYLIEHGINSENILKEERSATTFGNAFFSYLDVLKGAPQKYQSIIVISNEFHEPLLRYSFDKVFGNHHAYVFSAVPDATLSVTLEEIEPWKNIIKQLVEKCYPLLFSDVENGGIEAIQRVIDSPQRIIFESKVKSLLHLNESADIVIASEEELLPSVENMNVIR
jgi:uncharacterized SAM-binding protein YcdF (DUF218 family)